MVVTLNSGDEVELNQKYYTNVLVKIKRNIIDVGSNMYVRRTNNILEYRIESRYYNIQMLNALALGEVYEILERKFPSEIVIKLLMYYLEDNINFISIKGVDSNNTIKSVIRVSEGMGSCVIMNEKCSSEGFCNIMKIFSDKISSKLFNVLKSNMRLNDIFCIRDNDIDFCYLHKIYSSNNAWGITVSC